MSIFRALVIGFSVALLAGMIGLESFSLGWWVFLVLGNAVAELAARALKESDK